MSNRMFTMIMTQFCLFQTASAELLSPDDFAFGMPITVESESALYEFFLPEAVYRETTNRDLRDIRIFNHDGKVVPHTIQRQLLKAIRPAILTPLPFFPVFSEPSELANGRSIHIEVDAVGAIVDISKPGLASLSNGVNAYIIDLSQQKKLVSELELSWDSHKEQGFVSKVSIEYSNDLNRWYTLGNDITLADLNYGQHALSKRHISLSRKPIKYLRMTWPPGEQGAVLTDVSARQQPVSHGSQRAWSTLSVFYDGTDPGVFDYDSKARLPVNRLDVELPVSNSLYEVQIQSRSNTKATWVNRYRGLFYSLTLDGAQISNDEITIPKVQDRYWRISILENPENATEAPHLKLGWSTHKLLFVARGGGPYTLAFGSAAVEAYREPVDALLNTVDEKMRTRLIKGATLGPQVTLGGIDKLKSSTQVPWQRIVLWGILCLAVAILAVLAFRLQQQMRMSSD